MRGSSAACDATHDMATGGTVTSTSATGEIEFSVVIPTFRRQTQLVEAIESVLAQDVASEIIVLDDSPEGSARGTIEAFADARVTYLLHDPPSRGQPSRVRNAGWPRARGRFVHFLDDDDRVAEGFYRDARSTFERHPDAGVVFGLIAPFASDPQADIDNELRFFTTASRRARLAARINVRHWLIASQLFNDTVLVNSACVIRREHIAPLNGYDTSMRLNEDVDFYSRAIRRYGFRFLDQTVVHYRINPDSLMHGQSDRNGLRDTYNTMYEHYRAEYGSAELFALKVLARTVMRFL